MTTALDRQPIIASEHEGEALRYLDAVLRQDTPDQLLRIESLQIKPRQLESLRLIGTHGEEIILPESVVTALRQFVRYLASGKAVAIVPINKALTTQEAADILNISRPYLIKLLEEGALPYTKVGTHRRIQFDDVMAYKQRRDEDRQRALDALAALNEEMGLYDS